MASEDKAKHKAEEFKGRAKEKVGEATGNEQWQAEGKAEETKSKFKQAGEKIKDAVKPDEDENKD
ncbi:CsbD family protein [Saccharopolyspora halophila]|uniref:CsbD family protein n=1 Tax=Saccharopolyspora halophila TaxID=405551 RepID=A0ABN3GZR1_9PSEU